MSQRWAGVDVGAAKGFDVAVIDGESLVAEPRRITDHLEVVRWLQAYAPRVVAVDSPRSPAPRGERSRSCERDLVRAGVCGIRYTPNLAVLRANQSYYAWILSGFRLYEALEQAVGSLEWEIIECFPTATWSRLGERKGTQRSRARWSREVLEGLRLAGLPRRMNQDARDAIGAAVTARLYDGGATQSFGEIVVPKPGGPAGPSAHTS